MKQAWIDGKVMCGVSAGANCWFKECSSNSPKIKFGNEQPLIGVERSGFVDGLFVPHCDEKDSLDNVKDLLKTSEQIGLLMSNCTAPKIVDDKYRLVTNNASYHNIEIFGLKSYWKMENISKNILINNCISNH